MTAHIFLLASIGLAICGGAFVAPKVYAEATTTHAHAHDDGWNAHEKHRAPRSTHHDHGIDVDADVGVDADVSVRL